MGDLLIRTIFPKDHTFQLSPTLYHTADTGRYHKINRIELETYLTWSIEIENLSITKIKILPFVKNYE